MRGGAIPVLCWAALLMALMALNWVWTGDTIQVASLAFASLMVLGVAGAAVVLARRDALRRGPPPVSDEPETVPHASLPAALAGIAVAAMGLGLAFGRFLIYFGAGLLIASLGRLTLELSAQRRARPHGHQRERQ